MQKLLLKGLGPVRFFLVDYFILNMVKTLILQVTITVFHFNI